MKGVGPGTVLGGRYTVHRRVDQDRGTERWTADDTTLGRQVSVLVTPRDDHRAASFVDAARRASSVSHAVLVRILDVGQDDGVAYVVEEVLDDAQTLARLVTQGGIPGDEVRRITGEVAAALESARRRGMHHLDLTPADVLRTADGEVRLRGLEVAGVRAGEDALDPDDAARRDAVGVVALAYAGLTGLWPLGAGGSGLKPAPRVPGGVASPSEIAAGVPRDLDAICRLTLNDDQGPTTPGDYARQVAPWPSRQVVGKPVVPAITPDAPVAEPVAEPVGPDPDSTPASDGADASEDQRATTPLPRRSSTGAGAAAAGVAGAAAAGAAAGSAGATAGSAAGGAASAPSAAASAAASSAPSSAGSPTAGPEDPTAGGSTATLPTLDTPDADAMPEDSGPDRPEPPAWLTEGGDDPFGGPSATADEPGGPAEGDDRDADSGTATLPALDAPDDARATEEPEESTRGTGAALGAGIAGVAAGAGAAASRAASRASTWFSERTGGARTGRGADDADGPDGDVRPNAGTEDDDTWGDEDWGDDGWAAGSGWSEDEGDRSRPGGALVPGAGSGHPDGAAPGDRALVAGGAFGTVSTRVSGMARRAVDKVSELSPDTERAPREFDDEAPAAMVPAEPLTRDESKLALGIVIAFLVVALVVGIYGIKQIGSRTDLGLSGTPAPTGTGSASAAPSGSASADGSTDEGGDESGDGGGKPEPLAILKVEAYDPGGDGAENNNLTPKTYDGDTSTGWYSENYRSDAFGGLKDGLGLVVDLGPNKKPQQVQLDIPEAVDFEVYVGPDASLDGAKKIGEKTDAKGELDFDVPKKVDGQYVIVWYTGLHADDKGKRRAWLDEVVVTG